MNDLCADIMAVQAGLGDKNTNRFSHGSDLLSIFRSYRTLIAVNSPNTSRRTPQISPREA